MQIYDLIIEMYRDINEPVENLNKYSSLRSNRKYIEQINKSMSELMLDLQNSIHHSHDNTNF